MKKNQDNSKKSNSKKVQSTLNLKIANKITVQFSNFSTTNNILEDSMLFRIYLKSYLLGKSLKANTENYEINLFSKNFNFTILSAISQFLIIANEESFCINEESVVEIDWTQSEINSLVNVFDKKLNLNEKEESIVKNLLENKHKFLYDSGEDTTLIGFEEEMKKIEKIIDFSIKDEYKSIISEGNVVPDHYLYKGIIIAGPNGIGKSNMVKYINQKYKKEINFFVLDLLNDFILGKNSSESDFMEEKINNIFKFAKILSPAVVIFEDLDRLFTKGEDEESSTSSTSNILQLNDQKTKLIFSLIKELDDLKSSDKVIILSSATNVDRLSSDLRKCGRFDSVINLASPNQVQRKLLIKHFLKNFKNSLSEEDIEVLADKSHGFVAGDIIGVFKEALIISENKCLTRKELEISLKNIKPINLKDIILDIPKVLWSDIGGNKEVISRIRQSIEWPLKNPEAFKRIGITPPNGILLYGPPGCSKTMIAKALATESGLNFFAVKGPELFSKYVGDTEKAVRDVFKKAKLSSPSIIFFDEIDSMASQRGSDSVVSDKVLCQLLNEMDGIEGRERVVIFGATNRPDILDKALIRPGRFDRLIYIPPPDIEAKREIFKINLQKMSVHDDANIDDFLELTKV
jgi:SpoVK/Ycf46/Vps4 family AAA+-type ATPase